MGQTNFQKMVEKMKKERKKGKQEKKPTKKKCGNTVIDKDKWIEVYYSYLKNNMNIPQKYSYPAFTFANKPIDTYRSCDRSKVLKVKQWADDIFQSIKNNQWVYLFGNVGNGKTTCSISALYKIIEKLAIKEYNNSVQARYGVWTHTNQYSPVYFINVNRALKKIKMDFSNNISREENKIFQKMQLSKIVVMDDIFTEKISSFATETMHMWIDYRYSNNKPILFTSNMDYKFLLGQESLLYFIDEYRDNKKLHAAKQLERILDRINENCKKYNLEFKGKSFR